MKKHAYNFRFRTDLIAAIDKHARVRNVSRTALIERGMETFIRSIYSESQSLEKFQRAFKTLEGV